MACPNCGSSDVEREGGHWKCNACGERWGESCHKEKFPVLKELNSRFLRK